MFDEIQAAARQLTEKWAVAFVAGVSLLLSGCSGLTTQSKSPVATADVSVHGYVHGGQQPIVGSAIHMYAAVTSGYGLSETDLLTQPVTTLSDGSFNIPSNAFTCTAGQQLWLVAVGGTPGGVAGPNTNAANMAALGDCANINSIPYVVLNEVTTVGSAFALAPFMTSYSAVSTSAANTTGLAGAFASVNKLVNISNGAAVGSALPTGATGPTSEVNTLADALAACINTTGGSAGDGTPCGNLFMWATPVGGTAPTNTIDAAMDIAHNPVNNAGSIYTLAHTGAPFSPRLGAAPSDWTMSIVYAPAGISTPQTTTLDASGNVFVANAGNSTVSVLAQTGNLANTLTGNGLNVPSAVALDASGNVWITNSQGNSVSVFTNTGGVFPNSPFTGLNNPTAIAFDTPGNAWIANAGNGSVTELGSTGTLLQQVAANVAAPTAIVINPK